MNIHLENVFPYLIGGKNNIIVIYIFKKNLTEHYIHDIYIHICDFFRELTSKDPRSELGYRLTVQVDQHDPARPLAVVHIPSLGSKVKQYTYIS